jgi:maleylpyruvate isomerase
MIQGTGLLSSSIDRLGAPALSEPTGLDGWSRAHLIAHICANAVALGNLVHWAATGEPRPMYASPEQRLADIESGSRRSREELVSWFDSSAAQLEAAMTALTEAQWNAEVLTAQGRVLPAFEIPWLRAREVMVHTVDLRVGLTFADLPEDFLVALGDDVVAKRGAPAPLQARLVARSSDTGHRWEIASSDSSNDVTGPLASVVAYLAGRQHPGIETGNGGAPPQLPAWL